MIKSQILNYFLLPIIWEYLGIKGKNENFRLFTFFYLKKGKN